MIAADRLAVDVTDRVAASLVRLPISAFTDAECDDVLSACAKVFARLESRT